MMDIEKREQIMQDIQEEGTYKHVFYVRGKGFCGISTFMYTYGLCVDIRFDLGAYMHAYRFCYPHDELTQVVHTLLQWSVSKEPITEDPQDEHWIKKKGQDWDTREVFDDINPKIKDKHIE